MELDDTNAAKLPERISRMRRFPHAPDLEKSLARYQITSAAAHARVLMASGMVQGELVDRIVAGLDQIQTELSAGQSFLNAQDSEMYSALLRRLNEITGTASERLKHGRSDEDWLATDVRLWLRDSILSVLINLNEIRKILLALGDIHQEVFLPGYAHMQPRGREMLSFFFLAADSRFRQDAERFLALFSRVNVLPSGLDIQVMMKHPLDRGLMARLLGFDGIRQNTFDSVAEIDHLLEYSSCAAILGVHVSQLASELLLWMTQEFGFARLPRSFALENENFPGRKSTQIVEVLRARSSSLTGRLTEVLNQFKGLPFGSSQESSEVLRAMNEVIYNLDLVLELTRTILPALNFDTKRMSDASDSDMQNRANAIDYLIEKGFTSDKAVKLVDPLVEYCRKRKRSMSDLAPGEWGQFSPAFDRDIYKYVSSDDSLGNLGSRYEVLSQALAHGRQLIADHEAKVTALVDKVKSLTVELPSTTE